MNFQDSKCHKKLYKSGKLWVVGAIFTAFASGSAVVQSASADDIQQANGNKVNTELAVSKTQSKSDSTENDQTAVTTSKDAATKDDQTIAAPSKSDATKDDQTTATPNKEVATKDDQTVATQSKDAATKDDQTTATPSKGDATKDGQTTATQSKDAATKDDQTTATPNKSDATKDDQAKTPSKSDATKDAQTANASKDDDSKVNEKPGHYVNKNGNYVYQYDDGTYAKGLVSIDGHYQYFDESGNQVKGKYITENGKKYYLNAKSGNVTSGLQTIDNVKVAFNDDGSEIIDDFYYPNGKNGTTYYFDNLGQMVVGLRKIDGNVYYFDGDGQMKKGYSGVFNGQALYFDKTTGAASEYNSSKIKQGLSSQQTDFTKHNAVYSTTKDNFINVDGYLTPESWYRPKDILDKGKNWRASKANDFRPILMSWWPDKQTQVNYLNYMQKAGFIDNKQGFSTNDNQRLLNESANQVQKSIELKIANMKSTLWLKDTLNAFIKQQYQWSIDSETPSDDHLQKGAFTFVNSELTPDTNSGFRLMNRTPTNQTGTPKYFEDKSLGGFELLLANDVDNSNPVVQAEQLNWLYYLMHFGKITANDDDANFDGIRIDAVDNVDADLLNIADQYFKDAYGTKQNDQNADKHISILEDWSHNDPMYMKDHGMGQLTMDDYSHTQLIWSLTKPDTQRGTMKRFLEYNLVDRTKDDTENKAIPNYSFVRAHDSEVQTVIAQIVQDLYPDVKNSLAPTQEQLDAAFKVYNADMTKSVKKYTHYNMPSAYALMLTNKDTVPRVYYGDMYTDDGTFMENKSPYYDEIANLLKSRVKYVAGGQTMNVDKNDILTSVRFGKGANDVTDAGNSETRNEGIGLIVSNNHELKLSASDKVVLHMGAAHKNQAFRALMLTTKDGIQNYSSDTDAPVRYTDDNGDLVFDASDIEGVLNPKVSGYVSAWVPVGAEDNQDARTQSSDQETNDGDTFHSNAALDSQVIFEGFSNFQAMPTKEDEYANVRIAKNADLFKALGITSMQLAPQYRSSDDTSFLDSIIKNGYAFTDRYDLGFNTPTKYGTDQQLRDAIKSLHHSGIQVMADFVPDQLYNMKGQELTTVSRTNAMGDPNQDSDMQNVLYVTDSKGGGEYQKKYGGEFLDQLQKDYPDLFTTRQVSTGETIDASTKIKEWSAKYYNGSNIQGKGSGYVLKDSATGKYFKVTSNSDEKDFLPKQLTNDLSTTGFTQDDQGMIYFDASGYQARNAFEQDDSGNYYYFDDSGHMVTGDQTINGHQYYFLPNGVELRESFYQNQSGDTYYYGGSGKMAVDKYVTDQGGNSYYFGDDGKMIVGQQYKVEGKYDQYFDQSGLQVKDAFIRSADGNLHYYDGGSGNLTTDRYAQDKDGNWYYIDSKGNAVTGLQTIGDKTLFFHNDGTQSKGEFVTSGDGKYYYTDPSDGHVLTGYQVIDGHPHYFNDEGVQLKGGFGTDEQTGKTYYFSGTDGTPVKSDYVSEDGKWYYMDSQGQKTLGWATVYGDRVYFDKTTGEQVKNQAVVDDTTGNLVHLSADDGTVESDTYFSNDGKWYYAGDDGQPVKGFVTINGQLQYFDPKTGEQVKGQQVTDTATGKVYYLDPSTGNATLV